MGGQEQALDRLLGALTASLVSPEAARLFLVGDRHSILMWGPPGCGKTLMARVAAAEVSRLSGKRCRFGVVKPGEWEDPFVGVTQQNIRNTFRALKEAAQEGPAVLFLDEIEAVGRIRGEAVGHHSDKFLDALLAELDGFEDRTNVAIVAATNRKDLLDPALLGRLSDAEVQVGRPDLRGAEAILDIHLPAGVPVSPNGKAAGATRAELIGAAAGRLYGPNAGNELCRLRFRDGRTRTVCACELASGRMLEQVCRDARFRAFQRYVRGGERGVCMEDMDCAVSAAIERLSSALSVRNARAYLADLPQDVDIVAVEPVVRKVSRPHHYLNLEVA